MYLTAESVKSAPVASSSVPWAGGLTILKRRLESPCPPNFVVWRVMVFAPPLCGVESGFGTHPGTVTGVLAKARVLFSALPPPSQSRLSGSASLAT